MSCGKIIWLLGLLTLLPLAQAFGGARDSRVGTGVYWESSPQAALERAEREGKLAFVLHLSGNFANPEET